MRTSRVRRTTRLLRSLVLTVPVDRDSNAEGRQLRLIHQLEGRGCDYDVYLERALFVVDDSPTTE